MAEKKSNRSEAQLKAESKQDIKRKALPRFGGRCTCDEKALLKRLTDAERMTEKELIFKALNFYELNRK